MVSRVCDALGITSFPLLLGAALAIIVVSIDITSLSFAMYDIYVFLSHFYIHGVNFDNSKRVCVSSHEPRFQSFVAVSPGKLFGQ